MNNRVPESLPGSFTMAASVLNQYQLQQLHQLLLTPNGFLYIRETQSYMEMVRLKFIKKPHKNQIFMDILRNIRRILYESFDVVKNVSKLFIKDPELLLMFNMFLFPPHRLITIKYKKNGRDVYYITTRTVNSEHVIVHRTLLTRTIHMISSTPKTSTRPVSLTTTSPVAIGQGARHLPFAQNNTNAVTMNCHHTAHNIVKPNAPSGSSDSLQLPFYVELDMPDHKFASTILQEPILTAEESTYALNQPVEMNDYTDDVNQFDDSLLENLNFF